MKVLSPFGEYPFLFERIERKGATVSVVGSVAGVESRVNFDGDDLRAVARVAAAPLAIVALGVVVACRRRA